MTFTQYLGLGLSHILDPNGYDHILYVLTLCMVFSIHDWRYLIGLVTAFTVGHSITLALATLKLVYFPTAIIEAFIPLTILVNSIINAYSKQSHGGIKIKYFITVIFGLIHGLGFSNFLKSLLGKEADLFSPLLAFNIGLEIGQLLIVSFTVLLHYIIVIRINIPSRNWVLFLSGATAGVSFVMLLERIFAL